MVALTSRSFKKNIYNLAVSCTPGLLVCYVVKKLEAPYLDSIQTEKKAQAAFRAVLKDDFQSKVKKIYYFCYENLLSIPCVNVVILFVKRFFYSSKKLNLDRLWAEKKLKQLVKVLEQEMETPAGMTWEPSTYHKKAPSLPKPVPTLSKFARDLTLEAEQGKQRPFLGRVEEIGKIAEILGRNQKSNPLLIGAPGVGKTSIAEGIAQKIVKDEADLPVIFKGKRIFLLAWERLAVNAELYSEDMIEERLISILEEASKNKENVILFIDDIHAFLSDKRVALILKHALADGSLSCMGATTDGDYQRMIETNPALERRFPVVDIPEPSEEDMRKVLRGVIPVLEAHHGVRIDDQAVEACIKMGETHLKSQRFPGKAIDLLHQAANQLSLNQASVTNNKQLSHFLKLLIQMRNQLDNPSELDEKINETRLKFIKIVTKDLIRNAIAEKANLSREKLEKLESRLVLDQLWAEKKLEKLVSALEQEIDTPAGMTWEPSTYHKKAPSLPKPVPTLSKFARDLTLEAEQGKQRPFLGRVEEIGKIAEILGRNQKSNPLLIGAPGVGKSSIPEGIAQKIVKDEADLPVIFKGKRIFLLAWERLALNAERYSRDTLEKRLMLILNEASENKENVILFIDEIHVFLRDQKGADILKPMLADGSLSCMGATTNGDYQRMIETNPALERRFPVVDIPEPSEEDMRKVLRGVIPMLEAHHGVQITDQALEESIKLGERYLKSQSFPDKAIDLLDQAASRLKLKKFANIKDKQLSIFLKLLIQMRDQLDDPTQLDQKIQETSLKFSRLLTEDLIRNLVAEKVNLPLQKIQESEKDLLNNLEVTISKKIIGQKKSIASLCQGVRRARLKLGSPDRPAGVFLMLGPTGVGKTESAKVLSHILYGSRDNILRLDMSEYKDESDINKLIGAPPGYVGYGSGGKLTNWLKKKPLSIVLFDEIEKAHPSTFDLLLGVFDAGRITDGNNETVRCLDTIFMMTSNIGAQAILNHTNESSEEKLTQHLDQLLQTRFRLEFISRIQETVIFYPLSPNEVTQIVELQCTELKERVEKNTNCSNLKIAWDDSLIPFLAKTYYDPTKGARGVTRGILITMETPIGDNMIQGKIKQGSRIQFRSDGAQVIMEVN